MTNKQVTIYDIAREAGVSIATVSRVMSGHPNVSAKTLEKVNDVINSHKYNPSSVARGLGRRSPTPITPGFTAPPTTRPAAGAIPHGCTSCPTADLTWSARWWSSLFTAGWTEHFSWAAS